MKNLDLNKFGVQEMNAGEMRENNGGGIGIDDVIVFVISGIIWDTLNSPRRSAKSLKKGLMAN